MKSSAARVAAPTTEDIERLLQSPLTRAARPVLRTSLRALSIVRRYSWEPVNLHHLPLNDLPVIFAANHDSHSDTAAILDVLPRQVRARTAVAAALDVFGPGSKGPVRSIPNRMLQFTVGSAFHAFAFDRQGPPLRSIKTTRTLISNGWNLLLYPEGTRGQPGVITEFKAGVGLLARFTGRPVIPIYVEGGRDILPVGNLLPRAGKVHVHFGRPMTFEDGDSPDKFTERVRDAVIALRTQAELTRPADMPDSIDETARVPY